MRPDELRVAVGLGNLGPRYAGTRHNIGFDAVDRLLERKTAEPPAWRQTRHYLHTSLSCGPGRLLLVKPTTFMNDSGVAVREILQRYSVALQDILVLVDDVHLEPGRVRIRRRGSDGGHNGLRSILASVEDDGFPRLRIGIGGPAPDQGLIDFVLGRFGEDERDAVERSIDLAAAAICCWSREGVEAAMNRFNGA